MLYSAVFEYILTGKYKCGKILFIVLLSRMHTRTSIDQQILQELSASHNLVGDQAARPVCDH